MNRTCRLWFAPVFLFQASFFCFVSQHRLVDGDEGFYLLASRLVLQHKRPYLDFFFTQAPLLPYVYAAWLKLAGISWFSARILCALLTAILGGLIYDHVCRETGKWLAGISAVILFASASLVFAWFPIVKTFALSTLFLFLAYLIVLRPSASRWLMALAGACFGISVDARSYVVAVIPVFLAWILWRQRGTATLCFLCGFVLGIVPSLLLFFASPDVYLFNNLGYHAARSKWGLIGDWRNKARIARLMFTGTHAGGQFSILSASCAAGLILTWRRRRDASLLAFTIAFVLGVVSLLPTPSSLQYFSMIMPFLIVATVCTVSDSLSSLCLPQAPRVRVAGAVCVLLLAGFIGFGVLSFREYLFDGREVPGIKGAVDAPNWTLQQVSAVSQAIDELTVPGEQVASFWPGYIFASQADPYPGFENNFGMWIARDLTPQRRRRYHIVFDPEIDAAFAGHGPRLAVVGNQGLFSGGADYAASVRMLHGHDYFLAKMVGETSIYECCAGR